MDPKIATAAKGRLLTWFFLPYVALGFLVAALSCISAVVTFERWSESPSEPGVQRDVDEFACSVSAFGAWDQFQQPFVPDGVFMEQRYGRTVKNWKFFVRVRPPRREAIVMLGFFAIVSFVGRLGAWPILGSIYRSNAGGSFGKSMRRTWPGLAWIGPPHAIAVAIQGFVAVGLALGDLRLTGDSGRIFVPIIWLVSFATYILGGARIFGLIGNRGQRTVGSITAFERTSAWCFYSMSIFVMFLILIAGAIPLLAILNLI